MTKGHFGLNLAAVAILTFVLAFFGFLEALILIVAYALLIEKDPWLTRQTLQALYLKLAYNVAITVVGWVFGLLRGFFDIFKAFKINAALSDINGFFNTVLYICLFLLCALAVTRLVKEHDADIPLASNLAGFTMDKTWSGKASAAAAQAYPASGEPVAPAVPSVPDSPTTPPVVPPAPVVQPFKPASPFQAPAVAVPTVPEVAPEGDATRDPESAPIAPATLSGGWICSCGRENSGNFCMNCGNPRQV